jgi:MFS family permease
MVPPVILLAPLAGVLVDRSSKRRILLGAALGRGIFIGLLSLLAPAVVLGSHAGIALTIFLIFLLSCLWQIYGPARSAALPEVVEHSQLDVANSISVTVLLLMQIVGIFVGGLLDDTWMDVHDPAHFHPSRVLAINAACYGVTTLFLLTVRFCPPSRHRFHALSYGTVQRELLSSVRKLFSPRLHVRGAVLSVGVLVLAVGLAFPNLKDFTASLSFPRSFGSLESWFEATWGLRVGPLTRFTFLLFSGAAGAGLGIGLLSWLKNHFSQLVLIQAAFLLCGFFLFFLPRAHSFGLASLSMAGAGLGGMLVVALTEARIQRKIPPHLRGKVLSAYFMARAAAALAGAAIPGLFEQTFQDLGPGTWLMASGWFVLLLALGGALWHVGRRRTA